ncbi:hypothetical protein CDD83_3565 [Cordyceps sp. RAO-2017]|nr:hypothetical protein CDD83_3565 [Cordyceps sp. RAO-2017]
MDGRTTKSLQNQWTKVNKEISEMEANEPADGEPATPTKKKPATPRKGRPAKKAVKSELMASPDSGEEGEMEVKTPKKRGIGSRGGAKGTPKKAKKADEDADELEAAAGVKDETVGKDEDTEQA